MLLLQFRLYYALFFFRGLTASILFGQIFEFLLRLGVVPITELLYIFLRYLCLIFIAIAPSFVRLLSLLLLRILLRLFIFFIEMRKVRLILLPIGSFYKSMVIQTQPLVSSLTMPPSLPGWLISEFSGRKLNLIKGQSSPVKPRMKRGGEMRSPAKSER